jgi:aspartyl-tRNA(Asn)/glutamyl-tRNA(Gln) amidotransferase subunit C
MAKLTKADVLYVAKLSKLNLDEEEIKKFLPQLSSIVDFVSQLDEVDTKGMPETSQTTGLTNVLREDSVNAPNILSQDKAISGTDSFYNGLFKVDAILEERTDK